MKDFLIDAAIDRPHATLSVMALFVLAGIVARFAIPIESEPNIEVPFFMVSVAHEGISPEDAERLLLKPLESELRIIDGVDEVAGARLRGFRPGAGGIRCQSRLGRCARGGPRSRRPGQAGVP